MSSLLPTPREDLLEYADDAAHEKLVPKAGEVKAKQAPEEDVSGPPSPPTSPPKSKSTPATLDESSADPPLYAEGLHSNSDKHTPLFPQEDIDDAINRHIEGRSQTSSNSKVAIATRNGGLVSSGVPLSSLPTLSDYKLATSFVSILNSQNPRRLFQETMAENAKYYRLAKHPPNPAWAKSRRPALAPVATSKLPKPMRSSTALPKKPRQAVNRINKPPHRVSRIDAPVHATTPNIGKPAPPSKKFIERDFEKFQDISPSIELLGDRDDAFTYRKWEGKPIDLSNDPYRHLLHPSELKAAEALRLECDRWLVIKRLMFLDALRCQKSGKAFKKTDAQQAAGIDVNKASKIWEAFNSVGWFRPEHFHRYI